jgi:hypothetical protein
MHLGAVASQVYANCSQALPERYFSPPTLAPGRAPEADFVLRLTESPKARAAAGLASGTIRARFMRRGAYLGAHVGPPVDLRWENWKVCDLSGPNLASVVWHYFVKMALSLHAYRTSSLHVKAACVTVGNRGILIAGNGKTRLAMTLLGGIPASGFVTNTHLLVNARVARGVASNIRIKQDSRERASTATDQTAAESNETYAAPASLFGASRIVGHTNLDLIVLRRRVEDAELRITQINARDYGAYWEQFLYAIRCYDLEEDFFVDVFAKDLSAFERMIRQDRLQLDDLLHSVPVIEVCGSLDSESNRRLLLERLGQLL